MGHKIGMTRNEIMSTRWGTMMDMIDCMAIWNGGARQKKKEKAKRSLLEILEMR